MATNPQDMTPVEVDTFLAENYNEQVKYWMLIQSEVKYMEKLERRINRVPEAQMPVVRREWEEANARLVNYREKRSAAINASVPYVIEYDRRPWNRYYLVTNGNGHVHKDMNCKTCFPTTQYAWLVSLADQPVDEMIADWGERACTVCFPAAPTNPAYWKPAKVDREAQEAKAAEQAAKAAAKAEKAITDVDGSPLRVDGDWIKTKVAARNELSRHFQWYVSYGTEEHATAIRKLVPALEAAGIDWQPVVTRAISKAVKEAQVPANNPWRLTPEQIADHEASIRANTAKAKALLKEVVA